MVENHIRESDRQTRGTGLQKAVLKILDLPFLVAGEVDPDQCHVRHEDLNLLAALYNQ